MMKRILAGLFALVISCAVASAQFTDQRVWGGTSGGAANAQTLSIPNMGSYLPGVPVRFIAGFSNSTATQININSIGLKDVYKPTSAGATPLTGGEIIAGQLAEVVYDGTRFQLTANNAQSAAIRTPPQGYLTPCQISSGSPASGCTAGQLLPTGDVSAATALYYEPSNGNQIPIYNGSNMIMASFSELTLTIPSSRLANTIYDVCVFSNSGTPTVVFGPAWTTSTAGGGARGTGAGTAQITQTQGFWTNAVQISGVNGGSTFTVPANQCTIVASVFIDGTNGQVSFHRAYGQSRKWAAWNFYNRLPLYLKAGDGTASWNTASTFSIRSANSTAGNSLTFFAGLPEVPFSISYVQANQVLNADTTIGIGLNSTSGYTGLVGTLSTNPATSLSGRWPAVAKYEANAPIGVNVFSALEAVTRNSNTVTFFGTESNMLLMAKWNG